MLRDHWVGFDLGGTKMLAVVFDPEFQPIGKKRRRTKANEGDNEEGLKRISRTIRDALEDAEVERDALAGIGVGCPGPLDLKNGIIKEAPNLGWENVNLRAHLEREFDCPASIANDVDVGVYGEYKFGAARDARCALGIFPGTGIGGGLVYEDRIFQGNNQSCLEVGHVQVLPDGPLCGCGMRGCLEAVASRLAISAAASQAAMRGQAPYLLREHGTDLSDIRSGALADAVANGDVVIERIIREACSHIGVTVGGLVQLLAPDVVVLGGGLTEAMPELFVETVLETARKHCLPSYRDTFRIAAAELGDDAAVMGAAAWAKRLAQPR